MSERMIFDCHDVVAIAYPGTGRAVQGKVHLAPVPRVGTGLSYGVIVEGERALLELRKAIDHALRVRSERGGANVSRVHEDDDEVPLGRVAP